MLRPLLLLAVLAGCVKEKEKTVQAPAPPPLKEDNMWFDRVTQRWWITGQGLVEWEEAKGACEGEFRLPKASELREAWSRGICKAQPCPKVWAAAITATQAIVFDLANGEASVSRKREESAATYCIQL